MVQHSVAEARNHLSDTEMATRDITTGAWHPERMDRTGATQRSRSPGDRSGAPGDRQEERVQVLHDER